MPGWNTLHRKSGRKAARQGISRCAPHHISFLAPLGYALHYRVPLVPICYCLCLPFPAHILFRHGGGMETWDLGSCCLSSFPTSITDYHLAAAAQQALRGARLRRDKPRCKRAALRCSSLRRRRRQDGFDIVYLPAVLDGGRNGWMPVHGWLRCLRFGGGMGILPSYTLLLRYLPPFFALICSSCLCGGSMSGLSWLRCCTACYLLFAALHGLSVGGNGGSGGRGGSAAKRRPPAAAPTAT